MARTPIRLVDGMVLELFSDSNTYLGQISVTATGEVAISGSGGGSMILGDVGSACDLEFEESSRISGQGTNTITVGVSGDTFDLSISGVIYKIDLSTAGSVFVFPVSSAAPSSPKEGQGYYDSDDKALYIYNGTYWGSPLGFSGYSGYIPKFISSTEIANSVVYESADGNIGIGATNPYGKLKVAGLIEGTSSLWLENDNTSIRFGSSLDYGNGMTGGAGQDLSIYGYYNAANGIAIQTGNPRTTRMYINGSGYVGIGTTTPSEKLVVDGKVLIGASTVHDVYERLQVSSDDGDHVYLNVVSVGNTQAGFNLIRNQSGGSYNCTWFNYLPENSKDLRWYYGATGDMMSLTYDGKLGLGTIAPTAQLHLVNANSSGLTDFLINPTLKTSGELIDAQIGSVSKFKVGYNGSITTVGGLYIGSAQSITIGTRGSLSAASSDGWLIDRQLRLIKADSSAQTDFLINPTAKTSGNLIDAQIGGVSKLYVDFNGDIHNAGGLTISSAFRNIRRDSNAPLNLQYGWESSGSNTESAIDLYATNTNSSNISAVLKIRPTYNQSGTAGGTDLLISRYEQAIGGGTQLLIDAGTNNGAGVHTSKFKVDNSGNVYGRVITGGTTSDYFYGDGNVTRVNGLYHFEFYTDGDYSVAGRGQYEFGAATRALTASSGSQYCLGILSKINQSGTASATSLLINATETALGSGGHNLVDAQVGSVSKAQIQNTGAFSSTLINNADSDTDEIDSVTWAGGYGLLTACETTGATAAVWRLEGTTLTTVSVNAAWTATKDNAGTYNVYFETGAIKLQNKVGDNKIVKLGFYGML